MESVAICAAVQNPMLASVPPISLSIVFGMPTTGTSGIAAVRPHRALAADHDEPIERLRGDRSSDELRSPLDPGGLRAGRPEDRAPAGQDPPHVVGGELRGLAVQHPSPPVTEPDDGDAAIEARADDRADRGVQSGAVAATGQDAETHAQTRTGHDRSRAQPCSSCSVSPASSSSAARRFNTSYHSDS